MTEEELLNTLKKRIVDQARAQFKCRARDAGGGLLTAADIVNDMGKELGITLEESDYD